MQLEKGHIYHIYNQGNNKQQIFFDRDNYMFFLKKVRTYILPYADVLAWCLMPNHFHLMVLVNEVEMLVDKRLGVSLTSNNSEAMTPNKRLGVSSRHTESAKIRTFNSSIGIMLMAYTKALNKQRDRTGKLFREETKAECIDCINKLTPSFIENQIIITNPEEQYPQICFNYIHQNPVKVGLVKTAEEWEFSSAMDYTNTRNGTLINKEITEKYVDY